MDVSHTGNIAASSSLDAHIRLWDLDSGKQMRSIDAGPGKILQCLVDNSLVSNASYHVLYSIELCNGLFVLSAVDAWSVAFSPDSQHLATGSHVGKVNIFGVETGKKEFSLDTRGKFILSIAYVGIYG